MPPHAAPFLNNMAPHHIEVCLHHEKSKAVTRHSKPERYLERAWKTWLAGQDQPSMRAPSQFQPAMVSTFCQGDTWNLAFSQWTLCFPACRMTSRLHSCPARHPTFLKARNFLFFNSSQQPLLTHMDRSIRCNILPCALVHRTNAWNLDHGPKRNSCRTHL